MPRPCAGATVTWDGREVLVVGGRGGVGRSGPYGDGVAYDPASNRWRSLPATDAGRTGHTAVWTGRRLLVWGGLTVRAGSYLAPSHGVAFDPASDRWSALVVVGDLVEGLAAQVRALRPVRAASPWHWLLGNDPLRHGLAWQAWALPLGVGALLVLLGTLRLARRDLR